MYCSTTSSPPWSRLSTFTTTVVPDSLTWIPTGAAREISRSPGRTARCQRMSCSPCTTKASASAGVTAAVAWVMESQIGTTEKTGGAAPPAPVPSPHWRWPPGALNTGMPRADIVDDRDVVGAGTGTADRLHRRPAWPSRACPANARVSRPAPPPPCPPYNGLPGKRCSPCAEIWLSVSIWYLCMVPIRWRVRIRACRPPAPRHRRAASRCRSTRACRRPIGVPSTAPCPAPSRP